MHGLINGSNARLGRTASLRMGRVASMMFLLILDSACAQLPGMSYFYVHSCITKRYAINRWRASSVYFDWMIEPILWYCVTFRRHSRQESIRHCFKAINFVCSVVTRLFSKSTSRGFFSFSFPPALSSQRTYLSIYALEYITCIQASTVQRTISPSMCLIHTNQCKEQMNSMMKSFSRIQRGYNKHTIYRWTVDICKWKCNLRC